MIGANSRQNTTANTRRKNALEEMRLLGKQAYEKSITPKDINQVVKTDEKAATPAENKPTPVPKQTKTSLDQMVSEDIGSIAGTPQSPAVPKAEPEVASEAVTKPREKIVEANAASETPKTPTSVPQVSAEKAVSLAAQEGKPEQSPGIPVLNASNLSGLEPMSSRIPGANAQDVQKELEKSDLEIERERENDKNSLFSSTPIPSESSMRIFEQNKKDRLRQSLRPSRKKEETLRSTQAVTNNPDSIYNRPVGYDNKDRTPRLRQASNKRPSELFKKLRDRVANSFKSKGVGFHIYGKMLADTKLALDEVGVGFREITAVADQDPTMLNNLLSAYSDEPIDVSLWSIDEIISFINNRKIYVGTFKPPNNRGQDIERRRLVILDDQARGIFLHPFMAAMYTADFDGDDWEVSLDPSVATMTKNPMRYMVGIDNQQSLNVDFLPISRIVGNYEGTKSDEDYVRDVIFSEFFDSDGKPFIKTLDANKLIKAVIDLSGAALQDSDTQAIAWGDFFRDIREISDSAIEAEYTTKPDYERLLKNATGTPFIEERSDELMARLCYATFDGMQALRRLNAYTTAGADILTELELPEPRTYSDEAIYKLIVGMIDGIGRNYIAGEVPNNFQEMKLLMTGFLGNVAKKNAAFRFSADVGKMMKMDSRLMIGDEFEVDPNKEWQMREFFEKTVKFAESYCMAKEIKKAGRSQYFTQLMRDKVIKEVGFPDRKKADGTRRTFKEFLDDFYKSYTKNSALINEANLVYLSNMGIANDSNRGIVSPLNESKGGLQVSDLAEPLLSIYGQYSIQRFFGRLTESKRMGNYIDSTWTGNPKRNRSEPHVVERELQARVNNTRGGYNFWITGRYLNYSLTKFKNENRLHLVEGDDMIPNRKDSNGKNLEKIEVINGTKISELAKLSRNSELNDQLGELYLLMAIADKGTGAASKLNKNVYGATETSKDKARGKTQNEEDDNNKRKETTIEMMSKILDEINRLDTDGTVNGRKDQMRWIEDAIETLILSGPDMFSHFNMDSPAGFLKSSWAQKMIQHRGNLEVLGGIRTSMVFDYRMARINELLEKLPERVSTDEEYINAYNELLLAKDELADSSEVWHGIIREFEAEASPSRESVFSILKSGKRPTVRDVKNAKTRREWDVILDASDYWNNPNQTHTSLREVIDDLDLDRQTKWNVIADIVRYWENDAYLKTYEVGYQLEFGNATTYSINRVTGESMLKDYNDFSSGFNKWSKLSQEKMQEEVNKAAEKFEGKPGTLLKSLQRLDSSPWELIAIDDMMYADAILSVYDKSYAQTEKASQHPWTNAIYAALSSQRNGGYQNDIYRTDDRILGIISARSVGIEDIVHLLANPDAQLCVYDEDGRRGLITREALIQSALGRELSDNIEKDIWDFLKMSPRIASAIRKHSACVMSNTEGKGYIGASLSLIETLEMTDSKVNPINHVKYLMRDHPVYAAIISMVNPARGAVSRTARKRISHTESYLASQLYAYASTDANSVLAAEVLMEDLGITLGTCENSLKSDYDSFLSYLGLPVSQGEGGFDNGELIEDANTTYETVREYLAKYIEEIRENVPVQSDPKLPVVDRPEWLSIDAASMASFWDVTQELGGAKTSVSTGIEGAETFQYAEWVSHISAKDSYADLKAVVETNDNDDYFVPDANYDWNGLFTIVKKEDGTPMQLEVDEDGRIINYELLETMAEEQGLDEIVITVPVGYTVKDRSTDSHGTQVASLFAYMVSKRSNGAEAFNLKAKKAGLDGTDSITKMNGKYRMIDNGDGNKRRANYFEIEHNLQKTAQENGENGFMAAKQELAIMLMQGNSDLGYNDMTLANYMCLADLMLIEGQDGQVHLRTLEMLFNGIKNRLGVTVDDLKDEEIRKAADAIVRDNSETGIGITEMLDPLDALIHIKPKSRATSFSGVRLNSSVFQRNYDLLSVIQEQAEGDNVLPLNQSKINEISDKNMKKKSVKEFAKRIDVARNYSVMGYAGFEKEKTNINWTIGASNAIMIGDGNITNEMVEDICKKAYKYGMTVFVSHYNLDKIPKEYRADAMISSTNGDALIPMFDMRLNGAESSAYSAGRFAVFTAPYSRYVISAEDSMNDYLLGDAQAKPTKAFTSRIKNTETGSTAIKADDMFPNVFQNPQYRDCTFYVGLSNEDEISTLIANGVRCTIDYGVAEGTRDFEQRKRDVDKAIERYQSRWSETDADGMIRGGMTECHPGDIVGWMTCEIYDPKTEQVQCVLAPIIPYPLHGTKRGPETFTVQNIGSVRGDNTLWSVDWNNTSDLSYAKYFDSSGGANKGMMTFSDAIEDNMMLRDGTSVDVYIAKASTDSRKIGTDRRIKTMISLMALARMHGYNFAKLENAFPENAFPENAQIKETLLHNRIKRSDWQGYLDRGVVFTNDKRLNAFLTYECYKILENGGNPSDYLANTFTREDGSEYNSHVMWEFECMFEQGLNYEDGLLRFLHAVNPGKREGSNEPVGFCPNGIDDMSENYLFRLYRDGSGDASGYDAGVLQMQVPHKMSNGNTAYVWDNVYIGMSFFGEDFSGFTRPNIDGASTFLDGMNTMSYYGMQLDERSARLRAIWATSEYGRMPKGMNAIGIPPKNEE